MAELFGCNADNISLHLKNIYKEKELDQSSTTEIFWVVEVERNRTKITESAIEKFAIEHFEKQDHGYI